MELTKKIYLSQVLGNLSVMKLSFILMIFLVNVLPSYSQSQYFIKDKEGLSFVLNIDIDGNIINGYTRKRALLDYISKAQYVVAKTITNIKYPEVIRFKAKLKNGKFEGDYYALYNNHNIIGNIKGDSIYYSIFENNKFLKSYRGVKIRNYIKKDYVKLANDVIKFTEDSIFDTKFLQSRKWNKFKQKFVHSATKTYDDLDFQIGFFASIRGLGLSHYYIVKNDTTKITDKIGTSSLKEINGNTVILKINSFGSEETKVIKCLLDSIRQKSYKNLIIDLRDNPGGTIEPAFLIGNFLTDKEMISGFFPNRKWYEEFNRKPDKNDIKYFDLIRDFHKDYKLKYGFYISSEGSKNCFKGQTYILVNNKTGSACEALAISAKENHLAKIVGERTIGRLLYMSFAKLDKDIALIIPSYDFISYNGYRVEKNGVEPDIKTKKGRELAKVLKIIKRENEKKAFL